MFVIGHRGAAGLAPENTIEAIEAGIAAGVDMIEFDVRLTKDRVPVLMHDATLWRTHKLQHRVRQVTYEHLKQLTKNSPNPIPKLEDVLKRYAGKILINVELKDRDSALHAMPLINKYTTGTYGWDLFLISSFQISELQKARNYSKKAQLSLLHSITPMRFLFANRSLSLTAVGFHRLHVNSFAIAAAEKLGLFIYAYTVNRPEAAARLYEKGVDGIVTNFPNLLKKYESKHPELSS